MNGMFSNCTSLEEIDLSGFNTSSATDIQRMFSGCRALKSVDLSSFDTSKVTHMGYLFFGCSALESADLSSFDTSNVLYMPYMFFGCSNLDHLDLRNFNTSKADQLASMFQNCTSLKDLDVTSFGTSKSYINQKDILENCPAYNVTCESVQLLLDKGLIGMRVAFTTNTDLKTVVINGPAGEKKIDVSELEKNADGQYTAEYYINATQSHEPIAFSFYNSSGRQINLIDSKREIISYSIYKHSVSDLVGDYLRLYNNDSTTYAKLIELLDKLTNYCNSAENYFSGTSYTVTDMSDEDKNVMIAEHSTTLGDDVKISLVLNSATALRIYTESKNVLIDGKKAAPKMKNGDQYYELSNIAAQRLLDRHTVSIDGREYSLTPMSYVYRIIKNDPARKDALEQAAASAYLYAKAAADYVK